MNINEKNAEAEEYEELKKIISAVDEVMENTALLNHIKSEADRSYIFELKPDSTDILHMRHVWCAEGISPTFAEIHDISLASVPNWFAVLNNDGIIVSYDCEADKDKWPEEYAQFSNEGVSSIILVPLVSGDAVTGYMGIDNPDRSRVALTVSLLKGISSLFAQTQAEV